MSSAEKSVYYQHSGKIGIASRLSYAARTRMFERFTALMDPRADLRALDIGVTNDTTFRESNYFEQFYPFKDRIVCVGTENGSHLEAQYPGLAFRQVQSGQPLPFADGEFDIVFSNAVIEHVGNTTQQKAFLAEACRVGRRVFITTPNRWFPIEHHTSVPFLHYLPKGVYRRLILRTGLRFWADEQHLNLLSRHEFSRLFPVGYPVHVERIGIGVGVFLSNLVAYTTK